MTGQTTLTDKLFRIAIAIKGIDGALQLVAGLVLLFTPPQAVTTLVGEVVTRDLAGNHSGWLTAHLLKAAHDFGDGSTRWFAIVYLLLHAVIKLGLVIALLRKIMPAYPIAAIALAAFVIFELLRALHTHSIALPIFAALDVVIIVLILKEYRQLRRERAGSQEISQSP